MIRTVADLLEALIDTERERLEDYSYIKHPSLIGSMYEGLTKDVLDKAMFDGLDLRVVAGKIRNKAGDLSAQIDCMVVQGNGEQIPYSSNWLYPLDQVLAVVEVKKNLYSKQLGEAHENLLTILNLTEAAESDYKYLRNTHWQLTGEDIPDDNIDALRPERRMLFEFLRRERQAPLRVVFGFKGFNTEGALQESIADYLAQNLGKSGYGPAGLPSLIICGPLGVVKVNGSPYVARLARDLPGVDYRKADWWPFYASANGISILLLLEMLWTRLRQLFPLSVDIFGDDLEMERLNVFLFSKAAPPKGWEFYYNKRGDTELEGPKFMPWQPTILEMPEFMALQRLAELGKLDLNEPELLRFIEQEGRSKEDFVQRMTSTGLVGLDKSGHLVALAEGLILGVMPTGEFFVDRNDSPRSVNWVLKRHPKSSS